MDLEENIRLALLQKALEKECRNDKEFDETMKKLTENFRNFFDKKGTSEIYFYCEAALEYFKHIQEEIIKTLSDDYKKLKNKIDPNFSTEVLNNFNSHVKN